MTVDRCIEQALRSPDRVHELRNLAAQLLDEGRPPAAVLDECEKVRRQLRDAAREQDEDAVMDVMDFLTGWCSPQMKLPS